jgi:hypothetical protein
MIQSNQVSGLADLAEAAYIDFGVVPHGGLTESQLKTVLATKADAWPEARRNEFALHWRVVAHQPNTESGFSGTLFERVNPQPGEQRFVVAMRGTEGTELSQLGPDLAFADLGLLVADGLAWKQIIDMHNWWPKISTPIGELYAHAIAVSDPNGTFQAYEGAVTAVPIPFPNLLVRERFRVERVYPGMTGEGLVPEGERVDVTGHSLGGNLASAFAWLNAAQTHEVLTINGAGYSSLGPANSNVNYLFSALGGATNFGASNILDRLKGGAGNDAGWDGFERGCCDLILNGLSTLRAVGNHDEYIERIAA